MSKLTTKERNALPDSAFAGPNRSYPVEDKAHQTNAKARVSQAVKRGRMTSEQAARIRSKINKKGK